MDAREAAELHERARSGDVSAANALMDRHEGLVHFFVLRFRRRNPNRARGVSWEIMLHGGRIGLWNAIRLYRPDAGASFSTYAAMAIRHAVERECGIRRRRNCEPSFVSLDEAEERGLRCACPEPEDGEGLSDLVEAAVASGQLNGRDALVILERGMGAKLKEISSSINRSHEGVRQIEARALMVLRRMVEEGD